MLNQRVVSLPGLDTDRLLTNAQNLERALDEWHESDLDASSDIPALQEFANRWRKSAMLIALRALRRVEDLRLAQNSGNADTDTDAESSPPDGDDAVRADAPAKVKTPEKKRLSTPEYYEKAIADWAASGLDTSTNVDDFSTFAAKWRGTATLIALRADRRVDQLRTLEAHVRELEVRQMMAAEAQRQREEARVAEAARAFQAAQIAALGTGDNSASTALDRYEQELGDWSGRGLDKTAKVNDLVGFATKWRQDATLVSLRAERRVDHLRAMEFDARGGRVRTGTAADRRPVVEADQESHQEGMAAASAQAAAASYAYAGQDVFEPTPAARPVMERSYSVTDNFNFALDDWQNARLDDSTDIAAFETFITRWKNDATLIALRAERRIEALKKQQAEAVAEAAAKIAKPESHLDYIARHPIDLSVIDASMGAPPAVEVTLRTSAENIAAAVVEWDAAALEFSGDRGALAAFADRWRRDAEIIALRGDRRIEGLNAEKRRLEPDWQEALRLNTAAGYEVFQAKHPHSQYQKELSKRLLLIDEGLAWEKTVAVATVDGYRSYLQAWPSGTYSREARVGMMGGTAVPVVAAVVVPVVPVPTVTAASVPVSAEVATSAPMAMVAPPVSVATTSLVPVTADAAIVFPPSTVAAAPPSVAPKTSSPPRRTMLVWLAVVAVAAASALLAYFFLPKSAKFAALPQPAQVAAVTGSVGSGAAVQAAALTRMPARQSTEGRMAAPKLQVVPDRPVEQFAPPVEEPVPDTTSTSAVGPAATPASLGSAVISAETDGKTGSLTSTATGDLAPSISLLAPLNSWNVATAAHAGWSVPLAPLNDWNVATAAHAGWSVPLAPSNDWNTATAPHTGWSVPMAPLNDWNTATTPHVGWLPDLWRVEDVLVRLPAPHTDGALTALSVQATATGTGFISTASIPVVPPSRPATEATRETSKMPRPIKRRESVIERASAAPVIEPAEPKPQKNRPPPIDEEATPTLAPKRVARPAPEPEPEPEVKPRPRPIPSVAVAPKVEPPRKEVPKPAAVKEVAKPAAVKPPAPDAPSPNAWLRDIFTSRN